MDFKGTTKCPQLLNAHSAQRPRVAPSLKKALGALNGQSSEKWIVDAQFKILCAACWDEAKRQFFGN